jgi:hypothetical protein
VAALTSQQHSIPPTDPDNRQRAMIPLQARQLRSPLPPHLKLARASYNI